MPSSGAGQRTRPSSRTGLAGVAPQVTEVVLVDPDEARLAVVGPVSARIMRAHGHQAVVPVDHRRRRTGSTGRPRCSSSSGSADRRRGTGTRRGRGDFCCVGQETTGAGGLAKGLRTIPLVLEIAELARRPGRAGRVDHRLHQPGGDGHPCAARRRAPRGRALQRGDRAAADSRPCSTLRRSRCHWTTSGSTTSPGNGEVRVDGVGQAGGPARRSPQGKDSGSHVAAPPVRSE